MMSIGTSCRMREFANGPSFHMRKAGVSNLCMEGEGNSGQGEWVGQPLESNCGSEMEQAVPAAGRRCTCDGKVCA
eukprot:1781676-Pleurochrysis_carterae.AAC.1